MRLAGQAKLGFFACPLEVIDLIASHIVMPDLKPEMVTIMDPCCGEGEAIKRLSESIEVKPERVYCVELDKGRAGKTAVALPNARVINGSFLGMAITPFSFSAVYLNPPFDDVLGGGKREEEVFLQRAIHTLVPGGVLIMVLPFAQVNRKRRFVELVDANFENTRVYKFPYDHRNYNEVVILANKRGTPLPQESMRTHGVLLKQGYDYGYVDDSRLTTIGDIYTPFSRYGANESTEEMLALYPLKHCYAPHTFKRVAYTDDELQEVIQGSPLARSLTHSEPPPVKRPPLPLGQGHTALLLASGMINGAVSTDDGCHVVRGTSSKVEFISGRKPTMNADGEQTGEKVTYSQKIVMTIRAVGDDGVIKTFTDAAPVAVVEDDGFGGNDVIETPEPARVKASVVTPASKEADRASHYSETRSLATRTVEAFVEPEPLARSWKVACQISGETGFSYNAMRYSTKDAAEEAGRSLFMRWTMMKGYEVQPSDEEPNDVTKPKAPAFKSWKVGRRLASSTGDWSYDANRFADQDRAERFAASAVKTKPWITTVVEGSEDEPN